MPQCIPLKIYIKLYRAFLLSRPWAAQLSRDIPADAGFLCRNADVVDAAIEERQCLLFLLWRNRRSKIIYIKTLVF